MFVDEVMAETRRPVINAVNGFAHAPDIEVAVVGAGPHGLSAAVHLRRAGVKAQLFGNPMSFWRSMPKGMRLRSNMNATNLIEQAGPYSLSSYMAHIGEEFGHPVSLQRFVEYGTWVQRNAVPDVDTRMITRLTPAGRGFALELDDGDYLTAHRVVLACGIAPFENMPSGFDHLTASLVSHTGHHDDPGRFAGKRVAVVGGGQSAFESAVLMNERLAEVELIVRGPETVFLRSWSPLHLMPRRLGEVVYAPTDVGPLWYSRLVATPAVFTKLPRETQDRIAQRSIRPACSYFVKVRVEGVRITKATEVRSVEPAGEGLMLALSDGSKREVDHLMFGTGYKVNVHRYPFMSEGLLSDLHVVDGFPVLRHGFESSISNLHFLGAPAARSFGPIMRFVSGSWYGGTRLARALSCRRSANAARRQRAARGS